MPDVIKKRYLSQMTYKDTNLYKRVFITNVFKRDEHGKRWFLAGCECAQHLYEFLCQFKSNARNTSKTVYLVPGTFFDRLVNTGCIIITQKEFNNRFKCKKQNIKLEKAAN